MSDKICAECGTENEEKYEFCKNCGTELEKEEVKNEKTENGYFSYQQNGYAPQNPLPSQGNAALHYTQSGVIFDNINGINRVDFEVFIGKKSEKILAKFTKMQLTDSKYSWCWPAAILGYIFGPMGAALWFFYRKMYKPAVILTAIGAVLTFIINFFVFDQIDYDIEAIMDALLTGNLEDLMNDFASPKSIMSMLGGALEGLTNILTCILCGIFGFNIYKNHCIKKINTIKSRFADQTYYRFGMSSLGGVSGGALAIGIFVMLSLSELLTLLVAFIYTI